jgi:glucokinase
LMSLSPDDTSSNNLRKTASIKMHRRPLALGFDVGGTNTKIGLVTADAKVVALRQFPTGVGDTVPDRFVRALLENIRALLEMAETDVVGIGITFLGWVNETETGPYFTMNAPAFHNFNFRGLIEDAFRLPTVVHDDVTAHTLAEYRYGSGQGTRRFLCLAMGTGAGAGVIVDGKPVQYAWGTTGDAGHIILRPGGPVCASGCRGCAEAFIGVAGIERLAIEKFQCERPAHELIRGAARGDDPIAVAVLQEIGTYTGELLASLFRMYIPEKIALTGGTSRAGPVLLEAVKARFEELAGDYCHTFASAVGTDFTGVEIVLARVKGETGVIGAVADFFLA